MRPNPKMDERMAKLGYVSVPRGSDKSGIPRSSIYDAINDGRLVPKKMGPRAYLKVEELLEFGGEVARLFWKEADEAEKVASKKARVAKWAAGRSLTTQLLATARG